MFHIHRGTVAFYTCGVAGIEAATSTAVIVDLAIVDGTYTSVESHIFYNLMVIFSYLYSFSACCNL